MLRLKDLELADVYAQLQIVADDLVGDEDRQLTRLLPGAAAKARAIASHWDFMGPGRAIDELVGDTNIFTNAAAAQGKTRLQRVAIARLALGFFEVED